MSTIHLHPKTEVGLGALYIQAAIAPIDGLPALEVLFAPPGLLAPHHNLEAREDLRRWDYRCDTFLMSNKSALRTRCWGHCHEDEPSVHFVVSIENTLDTFLETVRGSMGFFVRCPTGTLTLHDWRMHGLSAHYNSRTGDYQIVFPITALGRGQSRKLAFTIDYEISAPPSIPVRVYREPIIDTPGATRSESFRSKTVSETLARHDSVNFMPPPSAWDSFGWDKNPGSAGEQNRFGWNPLYFCGTEDIENPVAAEVMLALRADLLRVEPSRPTWWKNLARGIEAKEPTSEYNFGQGGAGLHWSSKRTHGHGVKGQQFEPPLVPEGGWGGWNGEHFVSALFEYAYATQDPWALDLARDLGFLAANILCSHSISEGGYYGGGMDGGAVSERYFARCIRAILMAHTLFPNDQFLAIAQQRVRKCLRDWKPLGYSHRPGQSERVNGDEPVIAAWQLGLIAPVRTWFSELPELETIHDDWGRIWLNAWRGLEHPATARLAKFCLAADPSFGIEYEHHLEIWSYAFAKSLKGRPGIDEKKRAAAQLSIELRWPELVSGESKWACNDWPA